MRKSKEFAGDKGFALFDDEPAAKIEAEAASTKCKKTPEKQTSAVAINQSDTKKKTSKAVKNENNGNNDINTVRCGSISNFNRDTVESGKRVPGKIRAIKPAATYSVQKPTDVGTDHVNDTKVFKTSARNEQAAGKPIETIKSELKLQASKGTRARTRKIAGSHEDCGKSKKDNKSDDVRVDEPKKEVKGVKRLKQHYVIVDYVPSPSPITGKPVPVQDDGSLVEIVVNGEKRDVSVWSVQNGIYYPGLDGEFLVHCLKYKCVTSAIDNDSDNEGIAEFNKRTKSNYISWKEASHYQNLTEKLLVEFGDRMHWDILFEEHDMDKFSDSVKKKFKSKYAFHCTMFG